MIRFTIEDAIIREWYNDDASVSYVVKHPLPRQPGGSGVLAHVDTREEAQRVIDAINDMARQLRAIGEKVK